MLEVLLDPHKLISAKKGGWLQHSFEQIVSIKVSQELNCPLSEDLFKVR